MSEKQWPRFDQMHGRHIGSLNGVHRTADALKVLLDTMPELALIEAQDRPLCWLVKRNLLGRAEGDVLAMPAGFIVASPDHGCLGLDFYDMGWDDPDRCHGGEYFAADGTPTPAPRLRMGDNRLALAMKRRVIDRLHAAGAIAPQSGQKDAVVQAVGDGVGESPQSPLWDTDDLEWNSDVNHYARECEFSVQADSEKFIQWVTDRLRGESDAWTVEACSHHETWVLSAWHGRDLMFQLQVRPVGAGVSIVEGRFLGDDLSAFNDYSLVFEDAVHLMHGAVRQRPNWTLETEPLCQYHDSDASDDMPMEEPADDNTADGSGESGDSQGPLPTGYREWVYKALKLWCSEDAPTCQMISNQLKAKWGIDTSCKTILNTISKLRGQYGCEVVPTDEMRQRGYVPEWLMCS